MKNGEELSFKGIENHGQIDLFYKDAADYLNHSYANFQTTHLEVGVYHIGPKYCQLSFLL